MPIMTEIGMNSYNFKSNSNCKLANICLIIYLPSGEYEILGFSG